MGSLSSNWREFLKKNRAFAFFILLMVVVRVSVADHYRVPSGSMLPTIQIGDHILVNKTAYDLKFPFTHLSLERMGEPQRGDVIVFEAPSEGGDTLVKRLIAGPGDKVEIDNGFVRINGKWIEGTEEGRTLLQRAERSYSEEPIRYIEHQGEHTYIVRREPVLMRNEHLVFSVPQDHYFFMGDNRDNSHDSRAWGFVPRANLKGRARTAVGWGRFESLDSLSAVASTR